MPHPSPAKAAYKGKNDKPKLPPPLHHDVNNMPGPKMGPRPSDFDEKLVRQAPTFKKWVKLRPGEKIRYACRDFVKGFGDDEERLMRRIMIARRNNLKDHEVLKKARAANAVSNPTPKKEGKGIVNKKRKKPDRSEEGKEGGEIEGNDSKVPDLPAVPALPVLPTNPSGTLKRRIAGLLQPSDEEILLEMDIPAVEATRSYRKWLALEDGEPFTYNQAYVKGKLGDDWLLKKNIWRRMRYRRENQKMIMEMEQKERVENSLVSQAVVEAAAAAAESYMQEPAESQAAVEAAAAAAESYGAVAALGGDTIGNPLVEQVPENNKNDDTDMAGIVDTALDASPPALDAAAMLAAAVVPPTIEDNKDDGAKASTVEV